MQTDWLLLRCVCGQSFGSRRGSKASCIRCGESKQITTAAVFSDPNKLTEAVAKANLPTEIRDEINKKLDDKKRKQLKTRNHANPNKIQFILRQSTDERGILTLSSLHHILQCEGISAPSPEQIIGMAELQGVVQRVGNEEWKWLA